ncbi:unnamed protein product [Vitrella brassicaformis CCMP3155]|uniref:Uncharacterized protein n=2 Tax=Vitrella brassicaformis TaxID=1169539 RepID=A0A0G4FET8_VITBC|nr:unnamed protein product [Vitrella brassicaformis CCMP3155]|mmetsp:Transcript_23452/g.57920  ORF Transcript_23452/g.57920 Transcript_23452/m.57920 type:complete len:409 (+) Transcript_23452:31-1257(+)|eukprot:CEM11327.1 unnamed protein product [Vitrella brassicaformis CCMP3155]
MVKAVHHVAIAIVILAHFMVQTASWDEVHTQQRSRQLRPAFQLPSVRAGALSTIARRRHSSQRFSTSPVAEAQQRCRLDDAAMPSALRDALRLGLLLLSFIFIMPASEASTSLTPTGLHGHNSHLSSGDQGTAGLSTVWLSENPVAVDPTRISGEAGGVYRKARAALEEGRWDDAVILLERVTKAAPNYAYGYSSLGTAKANRGEPREALVELTRAIDLFREGRATPSDLWTVYLQRGNIRLTLKECSTAVEDLDEAKRLRGRPDALVLTSRAQALDQCGRWSEAAADYEGAVGLLASDPQPFWLRYCLALLEQNRVLESFGIMRRVQSKFPDAAEVNAATSAIYFTRGDKEGSARFFRLLSPDAQKDYSQRSFLEGKVRWPPKAVAAMQKAVAYARETATGRGVAER